MIIITILNPDNLVRETTNQLQIQIVLMNKKFSISTPSDFNFKECLRFLQRSDSECLFRVENEVVQFALAMEKEIFLMQVFWKKEQLRIEILKGELTFFFKKIISNYQ